MSAFSRISVGEREGGVIPPFSPNFLGYLDYLPMHIRVVFDITTLNVILKKG